MKKAFHKLVAITLTATFAVSPMATHALPVLDFYAESSADGVFSGDNAVLSDISSALDYFAERLPEKSASSVKAEKEPAVFLSASIGFEGKGTAESPYLIKTADDLIFMSEAVEYLYDEYASAHFKLANDIDMQGKELTPIGLGTVSASEEPDSAFSGVFDGDGHTISNAVLKEVDNYVGLFGLVYNAEIKNLTLENVKATVMPTGTPTDTLYVGGIAARVVGITDGGECRIENCHVVDGDFSIKTRFRVYGSANIGYIIAEDGASVTVSNCSATDSVCRFYVNDTTSTSEITSLSRSIIRSGGVIGYMSVVNAKTSVSGIASDVDIYSEHNDIDLNLRNDDHIGGAIGSIAVTSENPDTYKSSVSVSNSYSSDIVFAKGEGAVFAGGFVGYVVSTQSDVSFTDCHTSVNVYTQAPQNYSYLGGFSSIFGIGKLKDSKTVGSISLENVYTSGNVVDIRSKESVGGKLTAYIEGDTAVSAMPTFKNCYTVTESELYATKTLTPAPEKTVSSENLGSLEAFDGFDGDDWKISETLGVPVLSGNEFLGGDYTAYYYVSSANSVNSYASDVAHGTTPSAPAKLPDSVYKFSHWSLAPGSRNAFDGSLPITGGTIYFANDSDEYRSFTVTFIANGDVFDEKSLEYNSHVDFPTPPALPSDNFFKYAFSHWSRTENGSAVDTATAVVKGNETYYAVYKKINSSVWDGASTEAFTNGDGTVGNPYQISGSYQLAYLAHLVNNGEAQSNAYYVMTADADLGGYEWTPIGNPENPFDGHFLGDGYTVSDFKLTKGISHAGLFGYVKNAEISGLEISELNVGVKSEGTAYVGGITGIAESSDIHECMVSGTLNANTAEAYVGGIVASTVGGKITDCVNAVEIKATATELAVLGGIVGKAKNTDISSCYTSKLVSATSDTASYAGGLVGYIESGVKLAGSFFSGGSVSASKVGTSHGGLIYAYAENAPTLDRCATLKGSSVYASTNNKIPNLFSIDRGDKLYDVSYLKSFLGFDFNDAWAEREDALPVPCVFTQPKNIFVINNFSTDSDGTLTLDIDMSYRNRTKATVILSAYDERGKMIAFEIRHIKKASQLTKLKISVYDLEGAVDCKFSVIDPETLELIEQSVSLDL